MAVTITPVYSGQFTRISDVTATADADTTATVPHGMSVTPNFAHLVPLLAAFYTSQWQVTTIDATNVVLTKGTAVGSGNAGAQCRAIIRRIHSIEG